LPEDPAIQEHSLRPGGSYFSLFDFIIVAFAIFMAIKLINKLNRKKAEEPAAPPAPSKEEVLLSEIRDLLKEQNNRS